jgi:putative Mn2+ efflux pump MntP
MLSHFSALAIYAFFASIVFGITQRSEPKRMIHFGAYCFGLFLLAAVVVSWGMYFLKH